MFKVRDESHDDRTICWFSPLATRFLYRAAGFPLV
jgi:hypothetical protein